MKRTRIMLATMGLVVALGTGLAFFAVLTGGVTDGTRVDGIQQAAANPASGEATSPQTYTDAGDDRPSVNAAASGEESYGEEEDDRYEAERDQEEGDD